MAEIFISYRQADSKGWAIAVRDSLAAAFGEKHVFLDKETLKAGLWRDQIKGELKLAKVVLVMIGPRWLDDKDEQGRARIRLDGDVHREEVADALSRPTVTVIPVLVDYAQMPRADQLPDNLRVLPERQARRIGDTMAHRQIDLAALADDIQALCGLRRQDGGTSSPSGASWWSASRFALAATVYPLLVTFVIAVAARYYGSPLNVSECVVVVVTVAAAMSALRWVVRTIRSRQS